VVGSAASASGYAMYPTRLARAARLRRSLGPIGWSVIPHDSGAIRAGMIKGSKKVRATAGVRSSSRASGYLT
jgi:hypothetical protein